MLQILKMRLKKGIVQVSLSMWDVGTYNTYNKGTLKILHEMSLWSRYLSKGNRKPENGAQVQEMALLRRAAESNFIQ